MDVSDEKILNLYCGKYWANFWKPFNSARSEIQLGISVVGSVTNILNIFVFAQKPMRNNLNLILTALAISDFLFVFKRVIDQSLLLYINRHGDRRSSYAKHVELSVEIFLFQLFHTWAIYLTVLTGIWRFLGVWWPLRMLNWQSRRVAKWSIFVVILFGSIFVSLLFVNRSIEKVNRANEYISSPEEYIIVQNEHGKQIRNWVQGWIIKIIPCLILTCLTIGLIVSLFRAKSIRSHMTSTAHVVSGNPNRRNGDLELDRTTPMLLIILLIFLITEFPFGMFRIMTTFVANPKQFYDECTDPIREYFNTCELISSATSFFVYVVMSRKFRCTLYGSIHKCQDTLFPCFCNIFNCFFKTNPEHMQGMPRARGLPRVGNATASTTHGPAIV